MAKASYMFTGIKQRKLLGEVRSQGDILELDRSDARTIHSLVSQGILAPVAQPPKAAVPLANVDRAEAKVAESAAGAKKAATAAKKAAAAAKEAPADSEGSEGTEEA